MLNKEKLLETKGGSISGNLVSAFTKAMQGILELGRSLGSAIRRIWDKKYCSY